MKKIEDHLLAVFNTLSKDRNNWKYVTSEQKEKFFFIINRNLSKIYPNISLLLNNKNISKIDALDLWFYYLSNISSYDYVKKFWSKDTNLVVDKKDTISKKDYSILLEKLELKTSDLDFLVKYFESNVKEESKYLNKIKNQ